MSLFTLTVPTRLKTVLIVFSLHEMVGSLTHTVSCGTTARKGTVLDRASGSTPERQCFYRTCTIVAALAFLRKASNRIALRTARKALSELRRQWQHEAKAVS